MTDLEVWYSAYLAALAGGQGNYDSRDTADTALIAYHAKRVELGIKEEGD